MQSRGTKKIIAGFVLAVTVFFISNGVFVNAGTANFYPNICLGGWLNPSSAQGTPDVAPYSSDQEFNESNSSVLKSSVGGQMFCGNFTGDVYEGISIRNVSLNLSWSFKDNQSQPAQEHSSNNIEQIIEETFPSATTSSSTSLLLDLFAKKAFAQETNTAESTPATQPEQPAETQQSDPQPANQNQPAPATEPAVQPADTNTESTQTEPASQSSQDGQGTQTAGEPNSEEPPPQQETLPPQQITDDYFISVSYTINGKNWYELGKRGFSNKQYASFLLPINSWEDIHNLQISFQNTLSLENKPDIYLDGMTLEIYYEDSIVSTVTETAQNALEASVEAVADTSDQITQFIQDILVPDQNQEVKTEEIIPQVPKLLISAQTSPAGIPYFEKNAFQNGKQAQIEDVSLASDKDNQELKLSGNCSGKYFTVLIFPEESGYAGDPTHAIINKSQLCEGGSYEYSIKTKDFPESIGAGNYYLLVGSQQETGPWIPSSPIYSISITKK